MRFMPVNSVVAWALAMPLLAATPDYEPASHYRSHEVQGWTVHVHRLLLNEQKELGDEAMELLRIKLYDVRRAVPPAALARLREIAIWLEYKDKGAPCACYHPSRQWLTENGYLPDKEGSVEITCAANFVKWSLEQPSMVLHELAHGYHHRVLGHDHAGILEAYRQAIDSGKYGSVLYCRGQRKKAYAANNPKEYFAELTEAWFGANDFYPFVRAEVRDYDPQAAKLLEQVWKVQAESHSSPNRPQTPPANSSRPLPGASSDSSGSTRQVVNGP